MKRKKHLKIWIGAGAAVLLVLFLMSVITKLWVRKKIETALNENSSDYFVTIEKVKISVILPTIELEGITLNSKKDYSEVLNDINARIYKITNDTICRTDTAFLKLKADAMFMGKSKINVFLNARIYDSKNTFSLTGTLASMEAGELNPILENKAFIHVTSGKIQGMNFSFIADNTKAHGTMTMLYQGLDLAVKNKRTDDTTGMIERFTSILVNTKVMNSNPLPGKDTRVGTIYYERDPERFLISYCIKSLMSGIRTSLY